MRLSIRWRLTLWNIAVLAVVLALFATLVYLLFRHALYEQTDRLLANALGQLHADPHVETATDEGINDWIEEFRDHLHLFCVVYRPDGAVHARTAELTAASVPPVPANIGEPQAFDVDVPGIGRQRVIAEQQRLGGRDFTVLLLAPLDAVDSQLSRMRPVLLTAGLLVLLVPGLLAYGLARQALAPVDRLRRSADAITADRLDQRLAVANPHDEIGLLAQTINAMIARLERSFAEVRRFTADASHELRTPLTVLRTEVEVALQKPLAAAEQQQLLGSILEELGRMSRLTDQLADAEPARCGGRAFHPQAGRSQHPGGRGGGRDAAAGRVEGNALAARCGRARPGDGRCGASAPGVHQSAGQRPQVHAGGWDGDRARQSPKLVRHGRGGRYGHRHPGRAPAARVRPLLPGRSSPYPRRGRHRPRSEHRPEPSQGARRYDCHCEHARRRNGLHRDSAGESRVDKGPAACQQRRRYHVLYAPHQQARGNGSFPAVPERIGPSMKPYPLPVGLADLLDGNKVESDRLEFKEGWNPPAVLRTVCAFANDFHNYGGGYIVLGIAQRDGQPQLPPVGVAADQLDRIQRELLQYCNTIQPAYFPLLGIESVEGRTVVILWCPGGQSRPYKVPKDVTANTKEYAYYIRHYANSVVAKNGELQELIRLTATVPFDDRINHGAELDDLKLQLIRSYLRDVKSGLYAAASKLAFPDLCRQMAIVDGGDEFLKPRNVGLPFFSEAPERFFPYARIEVVHFPQGAAGDRIEEHVFTGPLDHQLRSALRHLQSEVVRERIDKLPDQAEAVHTFNYPYRARGRSAGECGVPSRLRCARAH